MLTSAGFEHWRWRGASWPLGHHYNRKCYSENTHLLCKGRYQCTADLLVDRFGFGQIRKSVADSYIEPIKEENIEEEENIYTSNFHPFNKNCEFILSDEKVLSNITNLKYKLSLKSSNFEEINKIIDELDDDL